MLFISLSALLFKVLITLSFEGLSILVYSKSSDLFKTKESLLKNTLVASLILVFSSSNSLSVFFIAKSNGAYRLSDCQGRPFSKLYLN